MCLGQCRPGSGVGAHVRDGKETGTMERAVPAGGKDPSYPEDIVSLRRPGVGLLMGS